MLAVTLLHGDSSWEALVKSRFSARTQVTKFAKKEWRPLQT